LLCQEGYYERPRKSKVQTIIPTSQMLAQMNLKEGSNRITFTFFTRMLGKQQVGLTSGPFSFSSLFVLVEAV
jgi:hypothetical protein